MDKNTSQKKLSEYRRIMLQREGLSFSDYFDDSVPYEVKPVPSTIPMEEQESDYVSHSDIPTQSKDLFKGLWEGNDTGSLSESSIDKDTRSLFIESMMPENLDIFKTHLVELFAYLKKELQLKTTPSVKLMSDEKNAEKVLGKTAYYNPEEKQVALFVTNRHQKDILRSFAHEIIHHWQHENEKLHEVGESSVGANDPQYAQKNPWLRQMEKQAYLLGNMLFRDWEDQKKAKDKKSGYDGKSVKENKKDESNRITNLMKQGHGKTIGSCGHVIRSCRCHNSSDLVTHTLSPCSSCMKKK